MLHMQAQPLHDGTVWCKTKGWSIICWAKCTGLLGRVHPFAGLRALANRAPCIPSNVLPQRLHTHTLCFSRGGAAPCAPSWVGHHAYCAPRCVGGDRERAAGNC